MSQNQEHRMSGDNGGDRDEETSDLKHRTNMVFREKHESPHSYYGNDVAMLGGSSRRKRSEAFDEEDPNVDLVEDEEDAATTATTKSVRFDEMEMETTIPSTPTPPPPPPPPPPHTRTSLRRRSSYASSSSSLSRRYSDDEGYSSSDGSGARSTGNNKRYENARISIRSKMESDGKKNEDDKNENEKEKKKKPSGCIRFIKGMIWLFLFLTVSLGAAWGAIHFGLIDVDLPSFLTFEDSSPASSNTTSIMPTGSFIEPPSTSPTSSPSMIPTFTPSAVPTADQPSLHPSNLASTVPSTSPSAMDYRWEQVGGDIIISDKETPRNIFTIDMSSDATCVAVGDFWNEVRVYELQKQEEGSSSISSWVQVGQTIDGSKVVGGREDGVDGYTSGFGRVGVSDDCETLIIGAPWHIGDDKGQILFFQLVKNEWTRHDILNITGTEKYALVGRVLSVNDDATTFAFTSKEGATNRINGNGTVTVYQYDSNSPSSFVQKGDILRETTYGLMRDGFGSGLDISKDGDTIVIGARYSSRDVKGRYQAYSFRNGGWVPKGQLLTKFIPEIRADDSTGGSAISLSGDGNTIAVGIPSYYEGRYYTLHGMARVFRYDEDNNEWNQLGKNIKGTNDDHLGWSLSLSFDGNVLALGSRRDAYRTSHRSEVFKWTSDNDWEQVGGGFVQSASDSGHEVSLSDDGRFVAVGGPWFESKEANVTSLVRVYERVGTSIS